MSTQVNVTVDDFDPLIVYDQAQWTTPNPQDNPSWAVTPGANPTPWHQGTYHATTRPGASLSIAFEATGIAVYGQSGPSYGNYSVSIDSSTVGTFSAYAPANSTDRHLLYSTPTALPNAPHTLELKSLDAGLLVDLFVIQGVQVGASGATLTNTTLEENSSEISYNGTWTTNADPLFSGGGSIYTSTAGDSLSFSFAGSALYITGDLVNDHGPYSVSINGSSPTTLSGGSGCGGVTGKNCEKLRALEYFKGNLPAGTHRVQLVNLAGERPFFDLDSIIYTTPSAYAVASSNTSSAASSSVRASNTASRSSAPSASATSANTSGAKALYSTGSLGTVALGVMGLVAMRRALKL